MNKILVLFLLLLSSIATAHNKVAVVPLGDNFDIQGNCPSGTGSNIIGGPVAMYNFCWYLSATKTACDTVCKDVGGTNLAYQAENEWSDDACATIGENKGPSAADITTWFFNNGNPGGWTEAASSGTGYHTLGYGFKNSRYFGKCSTGGNKDGGTYPGELSPYDLNTVCPCFGFVAP